MDKLPDLTIEKLNLAIKKSHFFENYKIEGAFKENNEKYFIINIISREWLTIEILKKVIIKSTKWKADENGLSLFIPVDNVEGFISYISN